ncbi:MAG: RNB domain-containing ribonuclease [Microbacteriaceae bacterium]|nr:RNB domain-containing ribonuclease [Microbacteriaceae bacterium]HOA86515.1 RNB domain-containing ribonuclease [Microbacteriaceae bacterium]HQC93153.1 RNB domain-containing ribonuclease [Microbacteriaceae bacterium]
MPARRSHLVSPALGDQLTASLAALRESLSLPEAFPEDVLAEADAAAASVSVDPLAAGLDDLRALEFLTIDPEGSMDLDQAMHLERAGDGAILHYAIADVLAFVAPGGAVDAEARRRGQTLYLADDRIPLHPPVLSEDAASLAPGVDRRAYVWRFVLDGGARPVETSLRRAVIRSRQKWSYAQAQAALGAGTAPATLQALAWFGPLRAERERERGGASLNIPDTEIVVEHGRYQLERTRPKPIEDWNAQVSLMTGMAAAELMLRGRVGILRTMPAPEAGDIAAFRARVAALGAPWPEGIDYGSYLRGIDRQRPGAAAVLDAAASLFRGAGYSAFDGEPPADAVQAAIGAPYAHATAPLRRLVDRWSLAICDALANDRPVPAWARESLPELPKLMARSGGRASQLAAGSIDRVEAAVLHGREGTEFEAVVLGERGTGARVQLTSPPITAHADALRAPAGAAVRLRLDTADVDTGAVSFSAA